MKHVSKILSALSCLAIFCAAARAEHPGLFDMAALLQTPEIEWGGRKGLTQEVWYSSVPLRGKPTRVFAYVGRPGEGSGPFPAMVLLHGGGGRAFRNWAEHWAQRGYVAIAMDLGGFGPDAKTRLPQAGAGMGTQNILMAADNDAALRDGWTHHAVAAAARGLSVLQTMPEVDPERIGITGISWGGYATCIAASIDRRVKVAVPVYGCGWLQDNSWWKQDVIDAMTQERRERWARLCDPSAYLGKIACPILFVNSANDTRFYLDSTFRSAALVRPEYRNLAIIIGLKHGHNWKIPEVDRFVDAALAGGAPAPRFIVRENKGRDVSAKVIGASRDSKAFINYARTGEPWKDRQWTSAPAKLKDGVISATLPGDSGMVWYFSIAGKNNVSATSECGGTAGVDVFGAATRLQATAAAVPPPLPSRTPPPWRMIYNNDLDNIGISYSPWQPRGSSKELTDEKIRASVAEAAVPGMGAQLITPGFGWVPMWKSKIVPLAEHEEWFFRHYGVKPDRRELTYLRNGGDLIGVFIDECHKHGNAALVSFRANDGHILDMAFDGKNVRAWQAGYISRFYVEHPEYRRTPLPKAHWNDRVHNWAIPGARDHKLALLLEIIETYPALDGVEVDFQRAPHFFPLAMPMKERVAIMTGFLKKIRAALDATAGAGSRHRYLGVRVPLWQRNADNADYWHDGSWVSIGFEPVAWAAAGVDYFNFSPHFPMNQDMRALALARKKVPGIRIYAELTHTPWMWRIGEPPPGVPMGVHTPSAWRRSTKEMLQTTARSAYARGADGVSFFNFCYYRDRGPRADPASPYNEPPFEILPSLTDRVALENAPCYFFKRGDDKLYIFAKAGDSASLTLDIVPARGNPAATLRLLLLTADEHRIPEDTPAPDIDRGSWEISINGVVLQPAAPLETAYPFPTPYKAGFFKPNQYLTFAIPAGSLKNGANDIRLKALSIPGQFHLRWLEIIQYPKN